MDPERVRWWHGAIFARRFPHDGRHFRREQTFFGVLLDNRMRQLEGATSESIRRELAAVCAEFNGRIEDFRAIVDRSDLDYTRAAAALYVASCECICSWTATTA
jgi:hypothetical protein